MKLSKMIFIFLLFSMILYGCQEGHSASLETIPTVSKMDQIKKTFQKRCKAVIKGDFENYTETIDPKVKVIHPIATKEDFLSVRQSYQKYIDLSKLKCKLYKPIKIPDGLLTFLVNKGFNPEQLQAVLVDSPVQERVGNGKSGKVKVVYEKAIYVFRHSESQWRLLISISEVLKDLNADSFEHAY